MVAAENYRELLLGLGLGLMHVGLRAMEPWAPGISWYAPGGVLVGIAVFGVRGGMPVPRQKGN